MATGYQSNNKRNRQNRTSISAPFNLQIPSSLRDPTNTGFSSHQLSCLTNDDNAREFALKHIHNHEQFANLWSSTTIHPNTRRMMRKVVQIQTINAVYNGFYRLPDGTKINLDKNRMIAAAQNTKQYSNDHYYDETVLRPINEQSSQVVVIDGDCLDAAVFFKDTFPQSNPVVLNMASKRGYGGGWKNGAGAQEENLHRRTNMFQCLEDPYYELEGIRHWDHQIPEFGGVYSPDVCVFRGSESNGYPFFPDGPKYLPFIACAAYSHPLTETDDNGEVILSGINVIENTKKKMRTILNIAQDNKHDIVILSAFGCGAFQNPPKHIAQLFYEVIMQEYVQSFKYIVFAIFDDKNARQAHNPNGNVQPFAEVFKVDILTIDQLPEKFSPSTE